MLWNIKYHGQGVTTDHWPHGTLEWSWYIKALQKVSDPITDREPITGGNTLI